MSAEGMFVQHSDEDACFHTCDADVILVGLLQRSSPVAVAERGRAFSESQLKPDD